MGGFGWSRGLPPGARPAIQQQLLLLLASHLMAAGGAPRPAPCICSHWAASRHAQPYCCIGNCPHSNIAETPGDSWDRAPRIVQLLSRGVLPPELPTCLCCVGMVVVACSSVLCCVCGRKAPSEQSCVAAHCVLLSCPVYLLSEI